MQHVHTDFVGEDDVMAILSDIVHISTALDLLPFVVEPVANERQAIHFVLVERIVVVSAYHPRLDAFALRVVLYDVLRLCLVAMNLHEVDVAFVLLPPV